ncbi:triose-phosphate isomerase [Thauera sp. CAU 1555]|uniref:Triosephosphate isomerase n=1 Tax=Thauera sedimentorum TaxID=2767595 RepID=A0ABR9B9S6_9RHOO|nr:triose-phosphate isomerase [Thauera sedimentorum]MBD8503070.1 triose-phosphate isomerase [Thauera sedimentorum]
MPNKLVAGNWKMHGSLAANAALLGELASGGDLGVACAVCVPYPYLGQARDRLDGTAIALGAQDVSEFGEGAYTGEVSAGMLAEFGCRYAIVGHSERRALFAEDDATVGRKAAAALAARLVPIVCVGETLAERESGETMAVIRRQLDAVAGVLGDEVLGSVVFAYEPVWAIGTGRSASAGQVGEVHGEIRGWLRERCAVADLVPILYGGSVKPGNAAELFAVENVDGGLIGGASLVANDFLAICRAAANAQS